MTLQPLCWCMSKHIFVSPMKLMQKKNLNMRIDYLGNLKNKRHGEVSRKLKKKKLPNHSYNQCAYNSFFRLIIKKYILSNVQITVYASLSWSVRLFWAPVSLSSMEAHRSCFRCFFGLFWVVFFSMSYRSCLPFQGYIYVHINGMTLLWDSSFHGFCRVLYWY